MQSLFVGIKKFDEREYAAFVAEVVFFVCPLVFNGYPQATVEECQLSQP